MNYENEIRSSKEFKKLENLEYIQNLLNKIKRYKEELELYLLIRAALESKIKENTRIEIQLQLSGSNLIGGKFLYNLEESEPFMKCFTEFIEYMVKDTEDGIAKMKKIVSEKLQK